MSDERLDAVRQLVRDGNYDAALQILYRMKSANVAKWIKQVEQKRADAIAKKRANRWQLTRRGKIALGVITFILIAGVVIGIQLHIAYRTGQGSYQLWNMCFEARGTNCSKWADQMAKDHPDALYPCGAHQYPSACFLSYGIRDTWEKE